MALSIKSEEADRLAREVASLTGESLTQFITTAFKERLERERRRRARRGGIAERLNRIAQDCAALPTSTHAAPTRSLATTNTACRADGDRLIDAAAVVAILFDEPERLGSPP